MAVRFIASGRGAAKCPPNPDYPSGVEFRPEVPAGTRCCRFELDYPAPECGWFEVQCEMCGTSIILTAAGRADDPVAVTLPCRMRATIN